MANLKTLKTVGVVIAGVIGVLAWHDSCTSVAIRKATDSITYGILYGCCIRVICDLYNK